MSALSRTAAVVAALAVSWACVPAKAPADAGIPAFRGLLATPPSLAFTCVTPGCSTTSTVKIESNVNRPVAIKRVVLSMANGDYTVMPSVPAPFILGAASDFSIDLTFAPTSAPKSEAIALLVTYTDASPDPSPDRIDPGELSIPLVRRLVGQPALSATPAVLTFGVVPVGARKSMTVTASNSGFGNIALSIDSFDAGTLPVELTIPTNANALIPDASVPLPVAFAPQTELYLKGSVTIGSSTPDVDPVQVTVEGTSVSTPLIALEPEERAIDFGDVARGGTKSVTVKLVNQGGQDLTIFAVSVMDPLGDVTAALGSGQPTATLKPLERASVVITTTGTTAGLLAATLLIASNDPARNMLTIPVTGTVTSPLLQVTPTTLSWGVVPMGWVVSKPIELKNVGFGKLTIKNLAFVGGSSNLFTLKNLPALPLSLDKDQRVAFEVEFRAETAAMFSGSVSIETDDPVNPFVAVPLDASGGSCLAGCPIANGTPSCNMGTCSIGMCNAGFYDTNQQASDGCECQDLGMDIGDFCSAGLDKGQLDDTGASTNYTGLLPVDGDVDWIRFYGNDTTMFFTEHYNVHVVLQSSDPTVQMCVYRYDTSSPLNSCFLNNETCTRDFSKGGSFGTDDSAMYYVKIFRAPNTATTCTSYTVYMSNG
jgi:hypothetical protein